MSGLLEPVEFRASDVANFDCGDADGPWCEDVSNWIKSEEGVFAAMKRYKTKVWLYHDQAGQLVGYGSLGTSNWEWPDMATTRSKVHHIPYLGIGREFRGLPPGDPEGRYSTFIVRHLIEQARASTIQGVRPIVTLFVDERNPAIGFYRRMGFRDYEKRIDSMTPGFSNLGMVYVL